MGLKSQEASLLLLTKDCLTIISLKCYLCPVHAQSVKIADIVATSAEQDFSGHSVVIFNFKSYLYKFLGACKKT